MEVAQRFLMTSSAMEVENLTIRKIYFGHSLLPADRHDSAKKKQFGIGEPEQKQNTNKN